MFTTLTSIADTEPPEFIVTLVELYQTLSDAEAPADAKREVAFKCCLLTLDISTPVEHRRYPCLSSLKYSIWDESNIWAQCYVRMARTSQTMRRCHGGISSRSRQNRKVYFV